VDIANMATQLGATVRQVRAVAEVESSGSGWDRTGLLSCLWERHWLFKRLRFAVPLLSDPKPGGYTVDLDDDGINDSWEKLADAAMAYGANLAFECASFGKFQIMGAHWKALGYRSAIDFVWRMTQSEAAHYVAFQRYVEVNGLRPALARVNGSPANCTAFARGYNGKAQKGYDAKIATAYRKLL